MEAATDYSLPIKLERSPKHWLQNLDSSYSVTMRPASRPSSLSSAPRTRSVRKPSVLPSGRHVPSVATADPEAAPGPPRRDRTPSRSRRRINSSRDAGRELSPPYAAMNSPVRLTDPTKSSALSSLSSPIRRSSNRSHRTQAPRSGAASSAERRLPRRPEV